MTEIEKALQKAEQVCSKLESTFMGYPDAVVYVFAENGKRPLRFSTTELRMIIDTCRQQREALK